MSGTDLASRALCAYGATSYDFKKLARLIVFRLCCDQKKLQSVAFIDSALQQTSEVSTYAPPTPCPRSIALRACYAMSGTDTAYPGCLSTLVPVQTWRILAICLCSCYAVSCDDLAFVGAVLRGYAATPPLRDSATPALWDL
eukprot:3941009-Rhodomonas_salina.4